jgi:inorganic triphosphatase YgiF
MDRVRRTSTAAAAANDDATGSELELKLHMPAPALPSLRAALRAHGAKVQRLRAHYFDTPEASLARARVALRLRLEGRHWIQTVKAEGQGVAHRLEHNVRVMGAAGRVPAVDPSRHAGSGAGALLMASLRAASEAGLVERYATDVQRLACRIDDARGTVIEAALDIGQVTSGAHSMPIAELELEHKGGPTAGVFDLAAAWIRHGGLWLHATTKAELGERLRQPGQAAQPVHARAPHLSSAADGAAVMRSVLQSALAQVIANAGTVADGDDEAEVIHQLRVGLRRLRTVLRELAELSPSIRPPWDAELARVFEQLGLRRDHETVAAAVRPLLESAGAPLRVWSPPRPVDPPGVVRGTEFQTTLLSILALAHGDAAGFTAVAPAAARALVTQRLDALHRKVERDGKRFEKLPLERQHQVRKRLKRLRYLADLTGSWWRSDSVRSYLQQLGSAQDALGSHNDVAVAAAAFRAEAAKAPAAWFAAGFLQAHLGVTARAARKALVKAMAHKRFWD